MTRPIRLLMIPAAAALAFCQGPPGPGPGGPGPGGPGPALAALHTVTVPKPANLAKYVRDEKTLAVLGKALFWDMQLGSDGRTACATCHFHAGADHRAQNQLSDPLAAFAPGATLTGADFPFHQLADPADGRSAVVRDSTARAGSAGVLRRGLTGVTAGAASDNGFDLADAPAFSVNGTNLRQVTTRNSPSVIDAVFNFRNFWDGRASNIFNGMTPFGDSDTRANAFVSKGGSLTPETVRIDNASLASQAVGPVVSPVEMAYQGRTWPLVGRRMLALTPLALQNVAASDSVLGPYANAAGRGLRQPITYLALAQAAFQPEYWNSSLKADGDFTQAESNFALFFGLAAQAYESTLVSGQTRYDRFLDGDRSALDAREQAGLQLFRGRAACATCHGGAETTLASASDIARVGAVAGPGVDTGFFRTGVTPTPQDIGLGGLDDFGNPLSLAVKRNARAQNAVNGDFKAPSLRNIEFTGPYFHNGGQATLEQVVEFYSRGGDFPQGGPGGIRRLNLSEADRASLVALMKAMGDDRVRFERAPFDHPELCVPVGAADAVDSLFTLSAADKWVGVPEVGGDGNSVPLQTFAELLAGTGADGSRAHAMTDACRIP